MLRASRRPRFTLAPLLAVATLSLMATLPVLSNVQLHAAPVVQHVGITVRSGDTLWSIAEAHATTTSNVSDLVDEIVRTNHLQNGTIVPGQRLEIPD